MHPPCISAASFATAAGQRRTHEQAGQPAIVLAGTHEAVRLHHPTRRRKGQSQCQLRRCLRQHACERSALLRWSAAGGTSGSSPINAPYTHATGDQINFIITAHTGSLTQSLWQNQQCHPVASPLHYHRLDEKPMLLMCAAHVTASCGDPPLLPLRRLHLLQGPRRHA